MNKLLEVKNLSTVFFKSDYEKINKDYKDSRNKTFVKAVDGVSFDILEGETVGLVGESGSGKTVTAYSILKLIPETHGKIISGEILFKSVDLLKLNDKQIRKYRGKEITMIFQEPMSALNPVIRIENQIMEILLEHTNMLKSEARELCLEYLKLTQVPEPERRMKEYPHQLSGGMAQRVMIAMALINNPSLIIADEPTTSLDVSIQSRILKLIKSLLSEREKTSMLLITHNFGVVSELCSRVMVMYGGAIQEISDMNEIFSNPLHPYTSGLLKSVLHPFIKERMRFHSIPGVISNLTDMPEGCKFCTRCEKVMNICIKTEPVLKKISEAKYVRCHLY